MEIKKYVGGGLLFIASATSMIAFQNCSPAGQFSPQAQESLASSSLSLDGSGVIAEPGMWGSDSSGSSSSGSSNTATPSASTLSASASCSQALQAIGWDKGVQLNKFVLEPLSYDKKLVGQSELPASKGFRINFHAAALSAPHSSGLASIPAGLSLKITNLANGAVIDVPSSHFVDFSSEPGFQLKGQIVSYQTTQSKGSYVNLNIRRDLLDSHNLRAVKFDLYCQGSLIASANSSFENRLKEYTDRYVRVNNSDIAITDTAGKIHSYAKKSIDGYVILNCPKEVRAGTRFSCTAQGEKIVSGKWYANSQHYPEFDNQVTVVVDKPGAGNYHLQVVAINEKGQEVRSNGNYVRIK
ncbi:hypothetical protein [Bdellovibrio bacteriovorus]|uniref:hypothetical protein n=1 Tax=Bdellovibrio bacteriovorus TaxID=959 RepID=UPI0035A574BF